MSVSPFSFMHTIDGTPVEVGADGAIPAAERALRDRVDRYLLATEHQVAWTEVIGNDAARAALIEAIEHPVTHRDLYAYYARKPPSGVLLHGPPGCGKTMLGKAAARAIAALHGGGAVPLLRINGPEIQAPFVGVTEAIIRDVFAYARAFAARTGHPLVVFIDEADALLPSRDGAGGRAAMPWQEANVATFLTELDGLETCGAFVILASNRPRAIDAALLRDGRCDRKIKVVRPDRAAAAAILRGALAAAPLAADTPDPAALAALAADALFAPELRLATLHHAGGPDFLTLGAIVNGAMLVGLVERAKALAFDRDLVAGTRGGLRLADLTTAVAGLFAENRRLSHDAAIADLAEGFGLDAVQVEPWRDVS